MVNVLIGDIFKSEAQTLVNTVNCVGVMGKGLALEFKKRFPDMFEDYAGRCERGEVKLGVPYLYRRAVPPWILNFPTKDHWRSVSRLADIIRGLEHLARHHQEWGITSLAVPPLGCGHGQLEWRVVGPTLYRYLKRLEIPVDLYAPFGTPHKELEPTFLEAVPQEAGRGHAEGVPNRIDPAWVALVGVLFFIEKEPYHWPIGRTSFQKIAYFVTESGIPTGLHYEKGSYGPYAADLKPLITRLVNNGLIHEERLGRMFSVRVGPTFRDACASYRETLGEWRETIERIADLFMRMNTQQAEVAATVHFAARTLASGREEKPSETDVLAEVLAWKQKRRPPLDEAEVAKTIRNLSMLGWLDVRSSSELPVDEEALLDV